MKVISYGGGVQSTALMVLATTSQLPGVDALLFANVGDDSSADGWISTVVGEGFVSLE